MLKKVVFIVLLLSIKTFAKAGDEQKVQTALQKVIVFLNGAQVTRTAKVQVKPGTSTIRFENLSPGIDVPSIQVHAAGEFTILSVKQELNYLNEQVKQQHVEELKAIQKDIADKIKWQNNMLQVYEQAENVLLKNQVISGQNSNLDLIKLKQALEFQTQELTELKKKETTTNNLIASLTADQKRYDNQLADILKGHSTLTSNILVTVSSKKALQSDFTLNYVVHNASWYPTYDIRAKNINSPINITYKANVSQQSGEDWEHVKLTLSTGNPTVSGNKPLLMPYFLNYGMYYNNFINSINQVSGKVYDTGDKQPIIGASIKIKGTSIGTVTDANGNFSLQTPNGAQTIIVSYIGYETTEQAISSVFSNIGLKPSSTSLNEVVVVGYGSQIDDDKAERLLSGQESGVMIRGLSTLDRKQTIPIAVNQIENQTNIEFNIENPYTVPSDGKQYTVEINEIDLNATYQYAVTPKISTDVFLTAQLTDWNKYNFLSGEASLFFEDTYIGKSLLDSHATNDTLNLSLGTDKNIVVTRTLQKEVSTRQYLGSNKKETKDWQIEIKNRKNQAINLIVEDQVPVSQNSAIEVEIQETSGVKPDPLTGKLTWNLQLKPEDDKKLELKYLVKYPKNETVIVQ